MSICPSGSEPKPNQPSSLAVTDQFLQGLLPPVLQWLYPFVPYVNQYVVGDVASFCATEPPDMVAPAADAFLALISGGRVGQALAAVDFINSVYQNYLWNSLCQCSGGSTPTPNTPPSAPSDLPLINPPSVVGPSTALPCLTFDVPFQLHSGDSWYEVIGTTPGPFTVTPIPLTHGKPVPGAPTSYRSTFTMPATGTFDEIIDWHLYFLSATYSFLGEYSHNGMHSTATDIHTGNLPTGTAFVLLYLNQTAFNSTTSAYNPSAKLEIWCGGQQPTSLTTPCCPPDQIASGILQQLLSLTTLIQRQAAPFAWVDGATHSGLTGDGHVSLADVLGARITITSAPGYLGVDYGDPDTLFDAGWLRWGSDAGNSNRFYLDTSPYLSFPAPAGQYTRLSYHLNPGVTISVTELDREP